MVLKTDYDNLNEYDKVFISKVFTDTHCPEDNMKHPNVEYGGTGFFFDKAPPLPSEIEHIMPDYHLYDEWVSERLSNGTKIKDLDEYINCSIGFTTRGCIRHCKFCVNQNYNKASIHSVVSEFLDPKRKKICLLDDNVFACKEWRNVFQALHETGKQFYFKQGLDERLLTDEKAQVLFNESSYVGDYTFAFDNIKDTEIITEKLKLIRKYTKKVVKFYLFCGFNHNDPDHYNDEFWKQDIIDLFKRIEILMEYKCLPYIMRYKDYEISPHRGMYINIARWCNQPSLFKKKSLRDFCEINGEKSSSMRYLREFENKYPEIAKQYFNLNFEDIVLNKYIRAS